MEKKVNSNDELKNKKKFETAKNKFLSSNEISNINKEDFEKFLRIKRFKEGVGFGRLITTITAMNFFCIDVFKNKNLRDLNEDDLLEMMENLSDGNII